MMPKSFESSRHTLLRGFCAGLEAVNGERCVQSALEEQPGFAENTHVIAIGKAACAMLRGAQTALKSTIQNGLLITGQRYLEPGIPGNIRVLLGAHPLPDETSFAAGKALCDYLRTLPAQASIVFLVSGGASAMVENSCVSLQDLQRANQWLLSSGLSIEAVNVVRKHLSSIKGGGLLASLPLQGSQAAVQVLLVSDTPSDNPAFIGSGLLYPSRTCIDEKLADNLPGWLLQLIKQQAAKTLPEMAIPHRIIVNNENCRSAIGAFAQQQGITVYDHGTSLQGDAAQQGAALAHTLHTAPTGLHVWGGETTVVLPRHAGTGGRNQHLALAATKVLAGKGTVFLLAAGTDGVDGNSMDAGALVDGGTLQRGEEAGMNLDECLTQADSGAFLQASKDLIHTGPTGTNVMDIVLGLKVHSTYN